MSAVSSTSEVSASAYLLLENTKPNNNLGPVLRCAAAFGIKTVLAVGFSKCSVEGSHGASKHVKILAFPTASQAIASLRGANQSAVSVIGVLGGVPLGVEIDNQKTFPISTDPVSGQAQILDHSIGEHQSVFAGKESLPIGSWPFDEFKIHCFAICKSKRGLSVGLANVCDKFIHLPHKDMGRGFNDGPILDVPSCLSIVLHHHSEWAGRSERNFQGHKFELERSHQETINQSEIRRNERKEKQLQLREEMESNQASLATFFMDSGGTADY